VVVGDDEAVGRDDEARTEARPTRAARGGAFKEPAEELRPRIRDAALGADVDDAGPRRLREVDPELEGRLERAVLGRVRPELGPRPPRRMEVDADRDEAADDEERDHQDN